MYISRNFDYYQVEFRKDEIEDKVCVTGEIKNNTDVNYTVAMFRIILYMSAQVIGNGIIKVPGLGSGKTKGFVSTLDISDTMITRITHWEITLESGY